VWRESAACLDEDPELFFPVGTGPSAATQAAVAKAVCRRCIVVERCLRWALHTDLQDGVCGGMTPEERRALRRGRVGQGSAV
jgi:WhiB family redox-sensing transcriptional regulator